MKNCCHYTVIVDEKVVIVVIIITIATAIVIVRFLPSVDDNVFRISGSLPAPRELNVYARKLWGHVRSR